MKWSWTYIATFLEKDYDAYVNWEDEYFICPKCGKAIYKCDAPYIELGMMCPVCETEIDKVN